MENNMLEVLVLICFFLFNLGSFFIGYKIGNKKVTNITCKNLRIEKPEYREAKLRGISKGLQAVLDYVHAEAKK